MRTLSQDLRYGARMLMKRPGFTLTAVLTLASGIGANTAIFSVVDAVLLKPLPFKEPNQLVMIWERRPSSGATNLPVAGYEFAVWREQAHSFEGLALIRAMGLNLTGKGEPETIKAWQVSAEFFSLLGVSPMQGRTFVAGEDRAGRNHIAVLSRRLWQRRFATAPDIVGQTVTLNEQTYTVVGVMPQLDLMPDVWLPLDWPGARQNDAGHDGYNAMARLKPGVTLSQAQAEVAQLARQLEQGEPGRNTGHGVQLVSLHENTVGDVSRALWVLFGAVGFVLLIACANVANLLLTRAVARQKEMAIRTALGATRWRLLRQWLTESLLLAALGGGLGLLLAWWLTDLLPAIDAVQIPRLERVNVDRRVLAATLGFSLLTGVLIGIAPALRGYQANLSPSAGTRATAGRQPRRHGSLLVVVEIALTMILLIGSGLMLKSFARLVRVEPGFDPSDVLRVDLSLAALRYPDAGQQARFYEQLLERLKALPGVISVGATSQSPLLGAGNWGAVSVAARPAPPPGQETFVAVTSIGGDYFRTTRIPLRQGRSFTAFDGAQAAPVVIINETMARQFWPDENPLGQRLRTDAGTTLTVVGVVGDVQHSGLQARPHAEMYLPHQQVPQSSLAVMVRTAVEPLALAATVREQVHALDQDLPAPFGTMGQLLADSVAGQRFNALLLSIFGALALGLALVGVFGVVNDFVAQRSHEIGVRVALGARRTDILKLVLGHGMRLIWLGVGAGLLASLALTRVLKTLLFEVSATDPLTFAAIALSLTVIALVACWLPARRATQVDPLIALRCD